jgi:hypothetical protein
MYPTMISAVLLPPQSQVTHIGIGLPFPAELAHVAVARHKLDFVAKGPELAGDGGDQIVKIAAGKVCAPDGAFEQEIADKGEFGWAVDDGYMSGRVAGAMHHFKHMAVQAQAVSVLKIAGRRAVFIARRLAVLGPLADNIVQEPLVILVGPDDIDTTRAPDFLGAACMVQMAVRQPDGHDLDALLLGHGQKLWHLAAGIDKHALHAGFGPEQGRVLLKRGNRNDRGLKVAGWGRGVHGLNMATVANARNRG